MDVKSAVARAKQEIKALFGDEGISDVGLEEVEYEDDQHKWRVTIGFSRPWDLPKGALGEFAGAIKRRDYKVVQIADSTDGSGRILSVRRLEVGV